MKKLLAFAIIGLTLTACGSDDQPANDEDGRAQVQACVAKGGTPYFTTNANGFVEFITCDEKS